MNTQNKCNTVLARRNNRRDPRTGLPERGFTLLETLIALGVSTAVVLGVVGVFMMIQRVMLETARLNWVNNEARNFSDWFGRDARMAAGLFPAAEIFPDLENVIILEVPSVDENDRIISVTQTLDLVAYYPSTEGEGTVMVRRVIPNPESSRESSVRTFGRGLEGSSFSGTFASKPDVLGAFVIHYQFKDRQVFRDEIYEMPISGSIRLRNKEQIVQSEG